MMYWLKKEGNKAAFDASSVHARKDFFVGWFADKMNKGGVTNSGSKDIGTSKTSGQEYGWVSKHQLVQTLGKEKAEARIASGKMLTRPDPVTGLSDKWSLEYKSFSDVGSEMEKESHNPTGSRQRPPSKARLQKLRLWRIGLLHDYKRLERRGVALRGCTSRRSHPRRSQRMISRRRLRRS